MYSTHTANLPIDTLPKAATKVHTFPSLGTTSLLSLGQLCDAGCVATFDSTNCSIKFKDQEVVTGTRNSSTQNLWTTTLPAPPSAKVANQVQEHLPTTVAATPQPHCPPPTYPTQEEVELTYLTTLDDSCLELK